MTIQNVSTYVATQQLSYPDQIEGLSLNPLEEQSLTAIGEKDWLIVGEEGLSSEGEKDFLQVEVEGSDLVKVYPNFNTYLNDSSLPYDSLVKLETDEGKFLVPKKFLSDMERVGEPDVFGLNDQEITKSVRTEDEKTKLIKTITKNIEEDSESITEVAGVLNFRPKISLVDEITNNFQENFTDLTPVYGRNNFTVSNTHLNTQTGVVSCDVQGKIFAATRVSESEMPELEDDLDISYTARSTFDPKAQIVKNKIEFSNSKKMVQKSPSTFGVNLKNWIRGIVSFFWFK